VQVPCLNGSDQLQTPTALLEALARRHDLRDVTPYHLHTAGPAAFAAPEQRGRFRSVSFFAGAPVRDAIDRGELKPGAGVVTREARRRSSGSRG
jgi:acyl-CoA hydrolase